MVPLAIWEWVLWGLIGAIAGAAINKAVVAWSWYLPVPYGPWSTPLSEAPPRKLIDRLPIVGWLTLRRESFLFGPGYWVRPLFVEILAAISLPLFLHWSRTNGGLPAEWLETASTQIANQYWNSWGVWRFAAGSLLLFGMAIATVVDFDEKTIPDQVTVTGTLIALIFSVTALPTALPISAGSTTGPWTLGTTSRPSATELLPLTIASPADHRWEDVDYWMRTDQGLVAALAVILVWGIALLPKTVTFRYGIFRGFDLMVASIVRPQRKHKGRLKVPPRRMHSLTRWVLAATLFAWVLVGVGWYLNDDSRRAVASAVAGLAVGGGIVWVVRLVAGFALGREAMGFGDVTLMAMIGAFLGWQPALIVFGLAPFTAIAVVILQRLLTREPEIAFGPYLCLATLLVMLRWDAIWNEWAAQYLFLFGDILLEVGVAGLVMGAVMLLTWGWIKGRFQSPAI